MSKKTKNLSRLTIHRRCETSFDCDYFPKTLAKKFEEAGLPAEVAPLINITEQRLTGGQYILCFATVTLRSPTRQLENDVVKTLVANDWLF